LIGKELNESMNAFWFIFSPVDSSTFLGLVHAEKQRVSIARAILKANAPILLCDEPTSSLDSETETDIMEHIKAAGEGRTTLIVAHRLSTIQDCDLIVVLDQGQVVEQGTHDELVQRNGRYATLLQMQASKEKQESRNGQPQQIEELFPVENGNISATKHGKV
jgi:ABC-type multidrug transport system ATPase subunit